MQGEAVATAPQQESRRLPPGSHGIPAELVSRNQRERLVSAMAEVCAESGYAGASAAAVARVAGVSSSTFYEQFSGKHSCLLASHDLLLERLLAEVDRAAAAAGPRAALGALVSLLADDPASARLLTVEILAGGAEGCRRHNDMVAALAERLGVDWVRTAGALALIGDRVAVGGDTGLSGLEDELAAALA